MVIVLININYNFSDVILREVIIANISIDELFSQLTKSDICLAQLNLIIFQMIIFVTGNRM